MNSTARLIARCRRGLLAAIVLAALVGAARPAAADGIPDPDRRSYVIANAQATTVPEPASLLLLAAGLSALAFHLRRRQR